MFAEPTLQHARDIANSVRPELLDAIATNVFDPGRTWMEGSGSRVLGAVDTAMGGWQGKAANAASGKMTTTAVRSETAAGGAAQAAGDARAYAASVRQMQQQINAIPDVDTSYSAAVAKAGGPAAVIFHPSQVNQNMAEAQRQHDANRDQAVTLLHAMDDEGNGYKGRRYFPAAPPPDAGVDRSGLPTRLTVESVRASGGSGSTGNSGASSFAGSGSGGRDSGSAARSVGGSGTTHVPPAHRPAAGGTTVLPADGTAPQGVGSVSTPVASGGSSAGVPAALPEAPAVSSTSLGVAAGAGGALLAAGGLAGRGVLARGAGGSGAGTPGDDASFRRNPTAGHGAVPGEEPMARSGAAAAGERGLAAGQRPGVYPPGAGARGSDEDDELNKRPDYLVETDELWGDGRLAAPPVLG